MYRFERLVEYLESPKSGVNKAGWGGWLGLGWLAGFLLVALILCFCWLAWISQNGMDLMLLCSYRFSFLALMPPRDLNEQRSQHNKKDDRLAHSMARAAWIGCFQARHIVDFRNGSWYREDVYDFLRPLDAGVGWWYFWVLWTLVIDLGSLPSLKPEALILTAHISKTESARGCFANWHLIG